MNNIKNVALVTGASSGIGEAISRELIKRGWIVIGIARSSARLSQIQKELSDSFIPMVCDVSKKEQIEATSQQILNKNLLPSLLFLNAGVAGESACENPNRFQLGIHEQIMTVNYFGVLAWVEFWEKPCLNNGGANFIATSSINAIFAPPTGSAYAASKAAIAKAFEGLSLTYFGTPLKFSVVYPGPVNTPGLKVNKRLSFTWKPEKMGKYMVDCALKGKIRCSPSVYRLVAHLLRAMPVRYTMKLLGKF
ncbi:MAG TPA: SDR family oxidoreductase [Rhabdochlamydiaceae bacterium]|jgi:3-hydroxy acid dehydrogenase/malonic semialdehyde reductase